jgi:K+-sensing histidine kinase KdpD
MDTKADIASLELRIRELENALMAKSNEVEEAKKEFFLNLSHNIRTPLNSIIGFSKLLIERTNDKDKISTYQQYIKIGSDQLLSYINDVMEYSKLITGKYIIAPTDTNLIDLLFDIQEEFRTLKMTIDDPVTKLAINYNPYDAERCFNIDKNVLLKAINHALSFLLKDESEGSISIDYWHSESSILKLCIADHRKNIEKLLPLLTIKEKANANNKALTNSFALQISKILVEKLGGVFVIHNNHYEGLTVKMLIPCAVRKLTNEYVPVSKTTSFSS